MAGLRGPIGDPDAVAMRGGEVRDRRVPLQADADAVEQLENLAAEWLLVAKEAVEGLRSEGATYQTATGFSRPTAHVANL
jgi:hypothetical protein